MSEMKSVIDARKLIIDAGAECMSPDEHDALEALFNGDPDLSERFMRCLEERMQIEAESNTLDLLIKARRYVGMVTEIDGDDPIFGVMDEIDAAIAKATGE